MTTGVQRSPLIPNTWGVDPPYALFTPADAYHNVTYHDADAKTRAC